MEAEVKGNGKTQRRSLLSRISETVFIIVCLLGVITGIWLYQRNFNIFLRIQDERPIGYVVYRNNVSQRLSARRLLWDRLYTNTTIYNGETLSTGAFSETAVSFVNNEMLNLAENTSVKILYLDESTARIELIHGSLTVQTDRYSLSVFAGAKEFELSPKSKAEFRLVEDGGFVVNLFRGNGSLNSGTGRIRRTVGGEALFVFADGTLSDAPMVVMASPLPGEVILNPEKGNARVEFNWWKMNFTEDNRVFLELAKDHDFQRQVVKFNPQSGASTVMELSPGTYYWRAYVDNPGFNTAFGKVNVINAPAPRTVSPVNGQTYGYKNAYPEVHFLWSVPREALSLLLEASDNARMENPRLSRRFESNVKGRDEGAFNSRDFGEGTWYWRVTAVYPDGGEGRTISSAVRSFTIARDSQIDSPVLLFPKPEDTVTIGAGQDVFFSWEKIRGAESYSILIAEDEALRNLVFRSDIDRNYYVYIPGEIVLEEKKYYWGVLQTDEGGNESPVSATRPFYVQRGEPRQKPVFPPDNHITSSAHAQDLFFTWKNSLPYQDTFQIASRSDFASDVVVEERISGSSVRGRFLPPGTYYWRVSTEIPVPASERGKKGARPARISSPPMRLVVLPSYEAPGALTPRNGENVGITEGIPLDFRWEKLNYADTYEFKLFTEGSGALLYEVASMRDTVVQVYFSPRTVGRYRWTVQAFTESGSEATRKRSLLKSSRFSIGSPDAAPVVGFVRGVVRAGTVHTPITLTAPRAGVSLPIDPSSPPLIRWSVDEPLRNSRVIFSRNQDPTSDPRAVIIYVDQGVTSIPLPALTEGLWYWIVQGDAVDGQGISAAAPSWFSITARPPLSSPLYIQPEAEEVITLEQLMEDRNITFIWEEVPEANAYIFSLYGVTDKQELLFASSPEPDTSFILTDLALLTLEDYVWQVEAVTISRSGTVERRGLLEQHPFKVNITRSDSIRTRSQGTMYGL